MTLKYNPFTHKFDYVGTEGGPSGNLTSLTGTSGGPVYGDSNGNISLLLPGGTIVGDPTNHNLTFNPASGGGFSPNSSIQLSDDFIGSQKDSNGFLASNYPWTGFVNITATTDNTHPGQVGFETFGSAVYTLMLSTMDASFNFLGAFILGGGSIVLNWVFRIAQLSNITSRYTLQIGFGDSNGSDQANGVYFEYSDNENSGNWILKTISASTSTITNTSTAVTAGWHNAQVTINAAGTSANFTIDGVSLGNITTHIPTVAISPFVQVISASVSADAEVVFVDLFYLNQTLTTTR